MQRLASQLPRWTWFTASKQVLKARIDYTVLDAPSANVSCGELFCLDCKQHVCACHNKTFHIAFVLSLCGSRIRDQVWCAQEESWFPSSLGGQVEVFHCGNPANPEESRISPFCRTLRSCELHPVAWHIWKTSRILTSFLHLGFSQCVTLQRVLI